MAASTGVGAVPLALMTFTQVSVAVASAGAVGVMLTISFDLIGEAFALAPLRAVCGVLVGALFISWASTLSHSLSNVRMAGLSGSAASKALLMVMIMTLHSVGEGLGVGVAFATDSGATDSAVELGQGSAVSGLYMALAIAVHNLPEGLVVAIPIVARGGSVLSASMYAVATSAPQPVVAVASFAFARTFALVVPFGSGFAGGCMMWVCFSELIPDVLGALSPRVAGLVAVAAVACISFVKTLLIGVV